MTLVDTVRKLVEQEVEGTPYFLVDIIGGDKSRKVQVLIDGDEGVSIDKCSEISRAISKVVDEESFEADPFILEVSSPGADKPLKHERQYAKHIGRTLRIETKNGEQTGKLLEVKADGIEIIPEVEKKKKKQSESIDAVVIPFSEIYNSTVVLSFK